MKDLHSHLLYGIDDGSISKEESIELLNKLYDAGVNEMVLTPHYIIGSNYSCNNINKSKLLKELQKETKVKLYMGNEVFIDNNIISNIENNNISTINNSRYILIEFPLNEKLYYDEEILFELRQKDLVPIIAHPERYSYYDISDFEKFINQGCLLQGNITSLSLKYGSKVKKRLEKLLKNKLIHVMGTDTHRKFFEFDTKLKFLDKEYKEDILNNNFIRIINNQDVIRHEKVKEKR